MPDFQIKKQKVTLSYASSIAYSTHSSSNTEPPRLLLKLTQSRYADQIWPKPLQTFRKLQLTDGAA